MLGPFAYREAPHDLGPSFLTGLLSSRLLAHCPSSPEMFFVVLQVLHLALVRTPLHLLCPWPQMTFVFDLCFLAEF